MNLINFLTSTCLDSTKLSDSRYNLSGISGSNSLLRDSIHFSTVSSISLEFCDAITEVFRPLNTVVLTVSNTAPDPPPPVTIALGSSCLVYPDPGFVTTIFLTTPESKIGTATAPAALPVLGSLIYTPSSFLVTKYTITDSGPPDETYLDVILAKVDNPVAPEYHGPVVNLCICEKVARGVIEKFVVKPDAPAIDTVGSVVYPDPAFVNVTAVIVTPVAPALPVNVAVPAAPDPSPPEKTNPVDPGII